MINHQGHNSKGHYNYNAYTYVNVNYSSHFHKNFELIYVLDGALTLTVNGKTEHMGVGDCALILANQIHSFDCLGDTKMWIAVFAEQFVPYFSNRIENFEGVRSVFRCGEALDSFIRAELLVSDDSAVSIMMKKACFYAMCDRFLQQIPLVERKARNNDLICRVFDYVASHYREDISLASVAEKFGYEYHYLSRILNQEYHVKFSNLINEYRIDQALLLLETTDKSITDIAMESGFKSIRSFNHVFRAMMGYAPKEHIKTDRKPIDRIHR